MSIILPLDRPAIDIVSGSYGQIGEPWSLLNEPANKTRLEAAIAAVGRVDFVGHPHIKWGGTAFVVGPDLIMTSLLSSLLLEQHDGSYSFIAGRSAFVDFGHERNATGDSPRILLEEVVYVDPLNQIELFRATLPKHFPSLKLSSSTYAQLQKTPVAVIGYPAWDGRVEPTLMQNLFGAVMDVKRLLPGWTLGRREYSGSRDVLAHDCTTTGGCGGAPLIDVATGQVVGVHFAGVFLKENYAVLAATLSGDLRYRSAGVAFDREAILPLERIVVAERLERGVAERDASEPADKDRVGTSGALEAAPPILALPASDQDDDVAEPGEAPSGLEAIISADGNRPLLLARSWLENAEGDWKAWLKPHKPRIDYALRSVGKFFTDIDADRWVGTAFMVGDRLVLTASFGMEDVVEGRGARAKLKGEARAAVDFSDGLQEAPGSAVAMVKAVRFVHPFFNLALLEIESNPRGAAPLSLAAQLPFQLAGRPVVLLSYAASSSGDDVVVSETGRLYVQPGRALQLGQIPGSEGVPAVWHDCTTTPGSSGGPLLDLGTGYVLGVHTHGRRREAGFAQAAWEFSRDPFVWRHSIDLKPNPRPGWLSQWKSDLAAHHFQLIEVPAQPSRWNVNDVLIDWTAPEPKDLEKLLVATIEVGIANQYAEENGMVGEINVNQAPKLYWRALMKQAAIKGVLRKILEDIARDHAGLAPNLRRFL
jgi:S1-C subfamily serine protease